MSFKEVEFKVYDGKPEEFSGGAVLIALSEESVKADKAAVFGDVIRFHGQERRINARAFI